MKLVSGVHTLANIDNNQTKLLDIDIDYAD